MPARKTKRNDGRFAFTLRYVDPVTGERKRAYFYGRTQTEAKAKAEKARQRLTQGAPVRDASRTLADWLQEWQATFLRVSARASSTKIMHAGYCRAWPPVGPGPSNSRSSPRSWWMKGPPRDPVVAL